MFPAVRSSLRTRIVLSPALLLVLLSAACATSGTARGKLAGGDDGPLHDAVAEWDAAAAVYLPPPPPAATPRVHRGAVVYDFPELSLRAFSRREAERIRELQPIVYAAASTHLVAPDLVNGIIWVESRFQVRARSSQSACGLMQLMPRTGREVARNMGRRYDPFDPDFNIHAGTYYFARMLERYDGNMTLALAAYNIGPGVVDGWVRNAAPLPTVSRTYVANVFEAARTFRSGEI
jgi:soluble lytic murein transglycosylase-like protein